MTRTSSPFEPARAGLLLLVGAAALAAQSQPTQSQPAETDLQRVWRLLDQREPDESLFALAASESQAVRVLATRALWRVVPGGPGRVEAALGKALGDAVPAVRREAAFGLGQIRKPVALVAVLADPDPELRELAAAAIGKSGDAARLGDLLPLLEDRVRRVRGAAALAAQRLVGDRLRDPNSAAGNARTTATRALLDALGKETDESVRWQLVYALAHLADPLAVDALLAAAKDGSPFEKVFALRGLSAFPPSGAIRERLVEALADPDPRVASEAATALASPARQLDPELRKGEGTLYPAELVGPALLPVAKGHPSHLVRCVATRLLGRCRQGVELPEGKADDANLEAALVEARGRSMRGWLKEHGIGDPAERLAKLDWRVRCAWARIPGLEGFALRDDPDPRVRAAYFESFEGPRGNENRALENAAKTRDVLLRETVGEMAAKVGDEKLAPALAEAFADSPGPEFADARKQLLRAIATLDRGSPATRAFLKKALADPDLVVRREAVAQLKALGEPVPDGQPGRQAGLITPVLGKDIPLEFLASRPCIVLTTDKGEVELTLRPDLAPIHCWNLVKLVEGKSYDGLIIHRVVPSFVVQGGDHRGDGSGARAWHGGRLRDEINPLLFDAGVLGMPKTADPDTGGGQIFVTTVPTPHLDGRYTAFGTVTSGMDVVLALEVGDKTVRAEVR